jgi:hypothetical protein
LGIDWTVKIANGDSQLDIIEANLNNEVKMGGTTCTYQGKFIPCFSGPSQNDRITSQMLAEMFDMLDTPGIFD